jgi:hypothetical protein
MTRHEILANLMAARTEHMIGDARLADELIARAMVAIAETESELQALVLRWQEADRRRRDPVPEWASNRQVEREARNDLRAWRPAGFDPREAYEPLAWLPLCAPSAADDPSSCAHGVIVEMAGARRCVLCRADAKTAAPAKASARTTAGTRQ